MALLFFHSDFSPHIERRMPYFMTKKTNECVHISIDIEVDNRFPCLFRFLSVKRQNRVLRAIIGHNESQLRFRNALNEEELKEYTVPYDAMEVVIDGEPLTIAYSIKSLIAPIRRGILGPHGVTVYESGMPHHGPIFVFRSEKQEYENELGELVIEYKWREILTPPDRICECLRQGILDGGSNAPAHQD